MKIKPTNIRKVIASIVTVAAVLPALSVAEIDDKQKAIEVVTVIGAVKPEKAKVMSEQSQVASKSEEKLQVLPKIVIEKN